MTATSSPSAVKYTKVAIVLHWIIAALLIYMLFLGEELIEVRRGESVDGFGPTLHASLGILILLLTVGRIAWRLGNPAPPLPAAMPRWQVIVTAVTHGLLYVLMLLIPLLGWMALAPWGAERMGIETVSFFWTVPLNTWPHLGEWTGEAHELTGNLAKILVILHVLAALKHQFIDRDGILRRMTFR